MTLGALGVRRVTGQLTLRAEGKRYCIAFDQGAVVGASSPLAADAAVRVALIHQMIAPAQVTDVSRRIAAAPGRDEIEVLAEVAQLSLDQTLRLRRRVTEQRAARTFSIDDGAFVVDSHVDIPVLTALAIDIRSVIYLGARMNLSEQRLTAELRQLGTYFQLKPDAAGDLDQFGFGETEQPVLAALHAGATLAEIDARYRDLDPRTTHAAVYALAACSVATGVVLPSQRDASEAAAANDFVAARRGGGSGSGTTPSDMYSRTRTGRDVFVTRVPTGGGRSAASRSIATPEELSEPRTAWPFDPPSGSDPRTDAPLGARTHGTTRAPAGAADEAGVPRAGAAPRTPTNPSLPRVSTPSGSRTKTGERKTPQSGVHATAAEPPTGRTKTGSNPPATGRTKTPHGGTAPAEARTGTKSTGRMPVVGTPPGRTQTSPIRTQPGPTQPRTRSPGGSTPPSRTRTSEKLAAVAAATSEGSVDTAAQADVTAAAKEAFKRGQSRLRVENLEEAIAELSRAVELAPGEVDYAATLAWARFCNAKDKQTLAQTTRETLARAIRKSPAPEAARFYLGRVERMLGRDKEALRHFQQVLEAQPRHADAAAEVRVIEKRMAQNAAKESGVFGRKR